MNKNTTFNKGSIFLFLLSLTLLFLGFQRNQWGMVHPIKFSQFQKDVQSYVMARLVMSRQSGIFAYGGLLGWGDTGDDISDEAYQYQYDAYLNGLSFKTYWAKESHPGFQGILFSLVDKISPSTPFNNYRLFRVFTSGLYALTLAMLVLWFRQEAGWLSAILVLLSILTSQWMTVFGRNLFFVPGFFYLPMVVLLFRLQREKNGRTASYSQLFWIVFIFILLKCLFNGYDFILPTLGTVATPIVFYGISEKWGRDIFAKRFFIVSVAALTAILISLLVLSIQITYASGGFQDGIHSIIETINRRTVVSDPNLPTFDKNLAEASYWSILQIYLSESYFLTPEVPYYAIIILFAVLSVVYMLTIKNRGSSNQDIKGTALLATTWLSLLSPLSWYVIFKSVAYYHTHMNYLPWHMPFTLFGFGMCGYTIQTMVNSLKHRVQQK